MEIFRGNRSIFVVFLIGLVSILALIGKIHLHKDGFEKSLTGRTYYFDDGEKCHGLVEINGKRYLFDENKGCAMQFGFTEYNGNTYLLNKKTGEAMTGFLQVNDDVYLIDENTCTIQKGLVDYLENTYLFDDQTGIMKTGIQEYHGNKYAFDDDTGSMLIGNIAYGGYRYFTDDSGVIQTGFHGGRYFDPETGSELFGLQKIDGKTYYFDEQTGKMSIGLKIFPDHKAMYFDENGCMITGTYEIGGLTYHFDKDGYMQESEEMLNLAIVNSLHGGKKISCLNFSLSQHNYDFLLNKIHSIEEKGYDIGFVLMDVDSGKAVAYNCDEMFYSASTIKAPYIVSVAKKDLSILKDYNTVLTNITYESSNEDYSLLWNTFGPEPFIEFLTNLSIRTDIADNKYADYTPRELIKMWIDSYWFFERHGRNLGFFFEHPNLSPIYELFKDSYKTRTKAGWIAGDSVSASNDAGIIYKNNGACIMSVMSTVPDNLDELKPIINALGQIHDCMRDEQ